MKLISLLCIVQSVLAVPYTAAQHAYERGVQYLAYGDYRSALAIFDSLLAQQPQNHRLQYLSGVCKYQLSDYQGAARAMQMALRGDSLSVQYHIGLGRAYAAMNRLPAARNAFEQALRLDTGAVVARGELLRVLCLTKQFDDARQVLAPTATPEELVVMGKALLAAGKAEEALEYATRAVLMDSTKLSSRLLLADVYFVLQRYDDAFAVYAFLMMEDQNAPHVARKLALCYEKQGPRGIPVAILMMQKYLTLTGDSTAADLARIGSWFYARQRYDSSAAYYALAAARESTSAEVRFNYGLALYRSGKLRDAERELRMAERLSGSALSFQATVAKTIAAVLLQRQAARGAVRYYQKALRVAPADQEALYGLAVSYDAAGDHASAIRWYKKFLDTVRAAEDQKETVTKVKARIKELEIRK